MDKEFIRNKFRTLKRMGKYRRANDLAATLKMTPYHIHRILNGEFYTADDPQFLAVLACLNVTLESFFSKPINEMDKPVSNGTLCFIGDVPPGGVFERNSTLYMKCVERDIANGLNVVSLKTGLIGGMWGKLPVTYFPDARMAVS